MASSILLRAKNTIERTKARVVRAAKENEKTTALAVGGLTGTGVTVGLAFADQKMGNGHQWKLGADANGAGGVPVGAIAGAITLAPAFFLGRMPIAQAASVAAGTTLLNVSLYRYLIEEGVIAPGTPAAQ
jgi:hypothetical protein